MGAVEDNPSALRGRFTVDLTAVDDPIAGSITVDGLESHGFTGWLQLLGGLQEAIAALQREASGGRVRELGLDRDGERPV